MSLLGLLPLLAFIVFFLVLLQTDRDEGGAFVSAALGLGVFSVLVTEGLSLVRGVTPGALGVAWTLPSVVGAAWLLRRSRRYGRLKLPRLPMPRSPFLRFVAAGIGVIVVLTAVVAWYAPPNTWDALTYHMSRVAHWAQNASIAHYASGNEVQNYMPPAASILVLQSYVLGGGDRLANFVQWFSMVGCLVVAARIASRLGAGEKGRWYAAAFAATLPTGIIQATSVTTDYVVALWVAIAALEVVEIWVGRKGAGAVLELGAAAGLAMATKQTGLPYLAPFAALLVVAFLGRADRSTLLGWAVPAVLLLGLLNLGHVWRNLSTYASAGGPARRIESQVNQVLDGRVLLSNVLRNIGLHAGTPSPHANKAMALALTWLHRQIGLDINDPRTTSEGDFRIKTPTLHETVAAGFPHVYLLLALVLLAWPARRRLPRTLLAYAVVVLLTFILLSAMLQWKPTGARYHVAFFVLMAPVVGLVLEAVSWRAVPEVIVGTLMLASLPWLLGNHSRPLLSDWPGADVGSVLSVPRTDLYFANAPYLNRPYREMVGLIHEADCRAVAVVLPGSGLEYLLWSLLGAPSKDLAIEWLVGGTGSAKYADPGFAPCAVICEECPEDWVTVRGLPEVYHSGPFRVFMGQASGSASEGAPDS
jgi:hypothetical protein